MGRKVDLLITHIRKVTENETLNSTTDIDDDQILEYLNQAQDDLQSEIISRHPQVFQKETTIAAVQGQEEYLLPADVFLGSNLVSVEYATQTTNPKYYLLKPGYYRDRISHISGIPDTYIRADDWNDNTGKILLSPKPSNSTGQFRIVYHQRIDRLDKRRGVVSAVTLGASSISALTLDVSGNPPIDSTKLDEEPFFCVVDDEGNMKMRNVKFDSIDTSTGVVTVNSSFAFESGETIAVGDYIVAGKDTTSHVRLPRNTERYLIEFAAWKILKQDSSIDSAEQAQELGTLRESILRSFSTIQDDNYQIAVTDDWEF